MSPRLSCRYFDAHGNYYEKDDPESIQDNWLQDVDWTKVSLVEGQQSDQSHYALQLYC